MRIKITQNGDILVKRLSKANVFVHKIDHKSFGISERLKGSSSDLYALNSEAGDLYGIVGPLNRGQTNQNTSSFTGEAFSVAKNKNSTFVNKQQQRQQQLISANAQKRHQQLRHGLKMVPNNSSSDASTSSSSGGIESSSSLFYREKTNGNSDNPLNDQQLNRISSSSEVANHLVTNSGSIVLDYNKPMKIFDMSKFKSMLERESRLPYPNRKLLQSHCISIISFVVDDRKMLNLPSWIMIINIVAIDLLKIELGLVDPSLNGFTHSSTNINNSSILLYDPLVDRRRFGYHLSSDYNNSKGNSMTIPDSTAKAMVVGSLPSINTTTMSSHQQQQQRLNNLNHHLAASKKAFANAAALGAYNGDHYNHHHRHRTNSSHLIMNARSTANELKAAAQQSQRRYLDSNNTRSEKVDATDNTGTCHDSDLELGQATGGGKLLKHTESEVQQSSSSSGFNSHCSSQNDSSAASSSSNIASGMSAASDEMLPSNTPSSSPYRIAETEADAEVEAEAGEQNDGGVVESASALKPSMFKHLSKTSNAENKLVSDKDGTGNPENKAKNNICSNIIHTNKSNNNYPLQCRGKRPPKLPHRIVETNNNSGVSKMSDPIPIPAPPTSSVGGPSGKANLILVSPTGLSPPLPKRKGPSQKGVARSSSQIELTSDESHSILPEFSIIKHIDENGRCSVLNLEQQKQRQNKIMGKGKLPAGIPAHAQLAPPATQRHILRYLMSATRGKFAFSSDDYNEANNRRNVDNNNKSIPISSVKYQRPLPILPNQKVGARYNHDQQPEENLYYCGLQARVPTRRLIPHQMNIPPPQPNPISKSAINAILTDFRNNSISQHSHKQQQQHCQNDYLRQQYLPTSLQNNSDSHYLYQKFQKNIIDSPKSSTGSSVTKPLMKFFRTSNSTNTSNSDKNASNNITTKGAQNSSTTTTSMCLSVDNIHKKANQKSSQSLIGQALKLKKSRVKQTTIQ